MCSTDGANTGIPSEKVPPLDQARIRGDMRCCGGCLEQVRPDCTYFQWYYSCDIKSQLPGWLLKILSKEFGVTAYQKAMQIATKGHGPATFYGNKLKEDWEDIKHIQEVIDNHMIDLDSSQSSRRKNHHTGDVMSYTPDQWASDVVSKMHFPLVDLVNHCPV